MNSFLKGAFGLVTASLLTACDHSVRRDITDAYVTEALRTSEEPKSLQETYFIMEEGDKQLGAIFVREVKREGDRICARYTTWHDSPGLDKPQKGASIGSRKACALRPELSE